MNEKKNLTVEDGLVVTMDYELMVEGKVVDTSKDSQPIEFIQGQGEILPALEESLYDMQIGDTKSLDLSPEEGYGEFDDEAFTDVPLKEFPSNEIPLKLGIELMLADEDGEEYEARIVKIDDNFVRLDFNHPLAGKDLHFDVKVLGLRDATAEELEHGHVHGEGHEH